MVGLTLQDLFDQIVQYEPIVSSECPNEPRNVLTPLHRECCQLQTAIQPSVRVSSAVISSAERFKPITWLRNSAASEGVKRKSAARSSVNWPRARNRPRGSCGSSRVVMTRCICGGRCSSRKVRASSIRLESITW